MPQIIGLPNSRARRIRAASSLKFWTARMLGREERKSLSDDFSSTDLAKSSRATLLWRDARDRKSTRLNSSHGYISYAVFCLKKKNNNNMNNTLKTTNKNN